MSDQARGDDGHYIKIGATIDPSGAVAGAGVVVGEVDKIGDAAKKSGESFDASAFGSRREVGHLVRGLAELSEGGTMAFAGLGSEAVVLGRVLEGALGPAAPFMIAIGMIASIGIPQFEKLWNAHKKGSADASDAVTGDIQKQQDAVGKFKSAIDALLKPQEELEKSDARRLAAIEKMQAETQKQIELDKQSAIEKARTDYLLANATATTPQERKRLKDEFEAVKEDITSGSTVASAANAMQSKARDYQAEKQSLSDEIADREKTRQALAMAQATAESGRASLFKMGVTPDAEGKISEEDKKELKDKADAAQKAYDQKEADYLALVNSPGYKASGEGSLERLTGKALGDDVNKARDELYAAVGNVKSADSTSKLVGEAVSKTAQLTEKLQAHSDKIDEGTTKLGDMQIEMGHAMEEVVTSYRTQANDLLERLGKARAAADQDEVKRVEKLQRDNDAALKATQHVAAAEQSNAERAAHQGAEDQIADYKQRIDQAGHALPPAARQVLDDAMKKIEAMDRDNPMKEALDLMNLFIDRQLVINQGTAQSLQELRDRAHTRL